MLDPLYSSPRLKRLPTAEQQWARLEGKSEAMAADLLGSDEAAEAAPPPPTGFLSCVARIFLPSVDVALGFHWLR